MTRGRKPGTKLVRREVHLHPRLDAEIELLLPKAYDGRTKYRAFSDLVTSLLETHLTNIALEKQSWNNSLLQHPNQSSTSTNSPNESSESAEVNSPRTP